MQSSPDHNKRRRILTETLIPLQSCLDFPKDSDSVPNLRCTKCRTKSADLYCEEESNYICNSCRPGDRMTNQVPIEGPYVKNELLAPQKQDLINELQSLLSKREDLQGIVEKQNFQLETIIRTIRDIFSHRPAQQLFEKLKTVPALNASYQDFVSMNDGPLPLSNSQQLNSVKSFLHHVRAMMASTLPVSGTHYDDRSSLENSSLLQDIATLFENEWRTPAITAREEEQSNHSSRYRLCRRAGVIFEDENVYDELRAGMGSFIELVTKRIHVLMDNSSEEDDEDDEEEEAEDAVVICADDVIAALRDQHIASTLSACQVYGFGGRYGLRHAFSETILAIVGRGSVTHIDPIALSVMNDLLADFLFMLHDRAVQFGRSDAIIGYLAKVRAGPTNEADVCDGSAHVSLYIEAEHCGEFGVVPKVSESVHLITDASVRKALTALLFPTALELCKNAISSGRDAVSSALLTSSYVNQSLDVSGAGLQLVPQHLMRLCSERSPFKGTYSVHAAVYLAGAVQYLCEEIVDVAQRVIAEQDANCFEITSRHILLGIRDDSELNSLFPGAIRAGGVQPGTAIAPPYGSWKDMATEDDEEGVAVTRMLVQKARAQAVRDDSDIVLGVDPRDGRHFYYHHHNNNSKAPIIINGAAETAVDRIYPAPLADTFCQVEAAKRRAAAIAALSAKEGAIYRSFEESNNSIDINNDDDEEQEGDDDESIETLRSLYKIRLREIRYEQSSPQPVFHPADFARALQEASSNTHDDVRWTNEAAQVMQVACEYHLLQLCNRSIQLTGEASLNNRHLRKLKYILSL